MESGHIAVSCLLSCTDWGPIINLKTHLEGFCKPSKAYSPFVLCFLKALLNSCLVSEPETNKKSQHDGGEGRWLKVCLTRATQRDNKVGP